jgi:AcrR family transcriptional regulator
MLWLMSGRRSVVDALDTRRRILSLAADMASVEGLEGITVGRLAAALDMSKAGVIGHFGTKLELQLATLDHAAEVFRSEVWSPAERMREGMPRLVAICSSWMDYAGRPAFPGGCFLAAASFEFDSRPGPVRDALITYLRRWHDVLVREISFAAAAGDLPARTNAEQLAVALEAIAARVTPNRELYGDDRASDHAKELMLAMLGRSASGRARPAVRT